jgi:hypothetical protein
MQVVVVALEHGMGFKVDLHVEVARRAAIDTVLALAAEPDAVAFVDPGRNLDRQGLVLLDPAGAMAGGAGVGDVAAGAVAFRAGLLDREEALLHAHLAVAGAGGAGLGFAALLGALAVAGFAFGHGRDADAGFGAARGVFQRHFEVVAQVGAAIDVGTAAAALAATAEDVAEDVGEGVGKAAHAGAAGAHASLRVDAGVAVLVVGGALLRVGEDLVGFLGLLELLFRLWVVRIAVGMVLHGQLAVGLLDVLIRSVAVDAEDFVVVALLCHFVGSVNLVQRPS